MSATESDPPISAFASRAAAELQILLDRPPVALRLLAAARACVLDRGIARVTMSDVARRADVSRTTLYRHYPDVEAVLRDLMTLDFGQALIDAGQGADDAPTSRERLVGTIVDGCRALRRDALFRKILDVDPEYLLPYVTARAGASQRVIMRLFEIGIESGQEDGSVRSGDPTLLARLLLVQSQSLVISIGIVSDGEEGYEGTLMEAAREAFDAQLRPVPAA